jgi:hypothetical protein
MKNSYILSFFAALCISLSCWSMEPEIKKCGIEIPSVAENTGLNARVYVHPDQYKSWSALKDFTAQTLHNFETGDKRGLLYIHSLEDIMGARSCFQKKWNQTYPMDQRYMANDCNNFHDIFTDQEFVDHYISFILAERFLIAGSIVTYCDINKLNLTATFSPISFVMIVPPECIYLTERHDARSSTDYFPNVTNVEEYKKGYNDGLEKRKNSITTLDFLIRFPEVFSNREEEGKAYNMNEVGVLSCAVSGNVEYRPTVVAVLYNKAQKNLEFDYGNASRNICLVEAAEIFAKNNNLPFITSEACHTVTKSELSDLANEWFDKTPNAEGNADQYFLFFDHYQNKADSSLANELYKRVTIETMNALNLTKETYDELCLDGSDDERKAINDKRREISLKIRQNVPHFQEAADRRKYLEHKSKTYLLSEDELQHYGLVRTTPK